MLTSDVVQPLITEIGSDDAILGTMSADYTKPTPTVMPTELIAADEEKKSVAFFPNLLSWQDFVF